VNVLAFPIGKVRIADGFEYQVDVDGDGSLGGH